MREIIRLIENLLLHVADYSHSQTPKKYETIYQEFDELEAKKEIELAKYEDLISKYDELYKTKIELIDDLISDKISKKMREMKITEASTTPRGSQIRTSAKLEDSDDELEDSDDETETPYATPRGSQHSESPSPIRKFPPLTPKPILSNLDPSAAWDSDYT